MIKLSALLNEATSDYKIFVDMDGVLVNFVSGYEKFTGKKLGGITHGKANVDFWNDFKRITAEKGVSEKDFWAGLDWMPDGKQLWSYLKQYKPTILSAPGRNPESKAGKLVWIKTHLGSPNTIIDYNKARYAAPNHILIDDRKDFIDKWVAAGGIGILHISTAKTIAKLKELTL